MMRLNLALFVVLVICALALVTSQHRTRKLITELEKEQELAKQIDVEWGQLQLEQSAWSTHAFVENVAGTKLKMSMPPPKDIELVSP